MHAYAVLTVMDDDYGFGDDTLGAAEIDFSTAEFIKTPRVLHNFSLKLMDVDKLGNILDMTVRCAPLYGSLVCGASQMDPIDGLAESQCWAQSPKCNSHNG